MRPPTPRGAPDPPTGQLTQRFVIRPGGPADSRVLLDLFDDAVSWLTARGLRSQWGSTPFSADPARVRSCEGWASGGGMHLCEVDGAVSGALVLGEAPTYVPPAGEPEVYVIVLLASREPFARGTGAHLLQHAEKEARRVGVRRVRVDCFAGADGALVRYYEQQGFTRLEEFSVGDWPGQVLEKRW